MKSYIIITVYLPILKTVLWLCGVIANKVDMNAYRDITITLRTAKAKNGVFKDENIVLMRSHLFRVLFFLLPKLKAPISQHILILFNSDYSTTP